MTINYSEILKALFIIIQMKGVPVNHNQIIHDLAIDTKNITETNIYNAAKSLSFKVRKRKIALDKIQDAHYPVIAITDNGNAVIIVKSNETQFLIQGFQEARPLLVTKADFEKKYSGTLLFVIPDGLFAETLRRFDIKWFLPVIKKYKNFFYEVIIASFFIQLIALITPLFFQVIMDKVLVHQSLSTLNLITIGLFAIYIFEIALTLLRSYVFTHTVARVDVMLGAKLFKHILNLPISFFHARRVGQTVARVKELENIRSFLTGNSITVVMDAFFTIIFIAVMYYYSPFLTWIVIGSLPIYVLLSLILTPIMRENINEKFARGAENQAFLVETITGVETVKTMALEPIWNKEWDEKLSGYVRTVFKSSIAENTASAIVKFISKIVSALLLWGGVHLVIQGDLSVGQLIAFNMLSNQVSAPIIRIASLWPSFQQVLVSIERLGDILNTQTESFGQKISPPQIDGDIIFDNVTFRYTPDMPEVIKDLTLHIQKGSIVGLVGRSGSGKSTITKLLQRLYIPERGRIMVDSLDVTHCDVAAIRRQMGVVLQENILFNRSVRDNIALGMPNARIEQVIVAAKLAGAHEFITQMSHGYDTPVGEMGSSLSGGQRQRIALARALLPNPRILILDEATSALDYETEHVILKQMPEIAKDRTVIIIAHRLSCVQIAHKVHVIESGKLIESGSYEELLSDKNSAFAKLHNAQYQ
jgi:subfamily B ATP-binding cassette protein HlyB/CyaB